jgi:hypothetical protein
MENNDITELKSLVSLEFRSGIAQSESINLNFSAFPLSLSRKFTSEKIGKNRKSSTY